jgi:Transposase and inactivated derivatives
MDLKVEDSRVSPAVELLIAHGFRGMAEAVELLINEAMQIERSRYLGAKPYERTESRQGYANGYKPKQLKTRLGELNLRVPQVREGEFYPSFLEKGLRSERALKVALAEMYLQGVSTRKVNAVLEELCGLSVSSTEVSRAATLLDEQLSQWRTRSLGNYVYLYLDARYEKVREGGCVRDCAVLVAYGVNDQGKRDILGLSVSLSEAEVHWRSFLEHLVSRGLHGLRLIVSDAHSGLKAALKTVFPSVPWQRCQFHLQQNAQAYVTKLSRKSEVAKDLSAIFNAKDLTEAQRLLKLTVEKYEKDMPALANWMQDNLEQGLTIFNFPDKHQKRLRTANLAERVNREIKRRTQVVKIFPNSKACERLISALLMETAEAWLDDKNYLTI